MAMSDILAGQAEDRWWIAAPGIDESLRSLVERADRLYGMPQDDVRAWQDRGARLGDPTLDAPNVSELIRLARMLDIPARVLYEHRLEDGPHLLVQDERRAYCPQCLNEDRVAGRPRAFRRAWARIFAVSCSEHKIALQWAEPRLAAIADGELRPGLGPVTQRDKTVLALIDCFARTLEACLWLGAPWPGDWRGSPQAARACLIRCLSNLTGGLALPPVAQLWIQPSLLPFIAFSQRKIPALRGAPWDAVRRVGRPAWRRAAFWLTAWEVIPGLPMQLKPETIPAAYLANTDLWWHTCPSAPYMPKLYRTYATLRRLCVSLPGYEAAYLSVQRPRTKRPWKSRLDET